MTMTSLSWEGPYALINKNGASLCQAVKCRKHKRLYTYAKGLFCKKHLEDLKIIRSQITHINLSKQEKATQLSVEKELDARITEFKFRKKSCHSHLERILELQRHLSIY